MAAISETIEIARPADDVFAYATDFSRFPEWQEGALSVRRRDDGPLRIGSRAEVTRRVGPREQPRTEEITDLNPPRTWSVRGVGGSAIATMRGTIDELDGGNRSRLTLALDFEGHGLGTLLVPLLIRPQARKQLPRNAQRLKELLERRH
jgi:uncharacterized membrane protein